MDIFNTRNFGLLIAYVLPGFVILLGAGSMSDAVRVWLVGVSTASTSGPTVGSVLYVGLASIGSGMTASVVRWALVDTTHHLTGLVRPSLDESRLTERLDAFDYLVEQHYRYYQFYGNSLVALAAAYTMWRCSPHAATVELGWVEALLLMISAVFAAGSRDALRKYYTGSILLLGLMEKEQSDDERQAPSRPQQANPNPSDNENPRSGNRRLGGFEPGDQERGDASQGLDDGLVQTSARGERYPAGGLS